jgi:hypothetical protein
MEAASDDRMVQALILVAVGAAFVGFGGWIILRELTR